MMGEMHCLYIKFPINTWSKGTSETAKALHLNWQLRGFFPKRVNPHAQGIIGAQKKGKKWNIKKKEERI